LRSYQKFEFDYDKSLFSKNRDTYCVSSEKIIKILNIIVDPERWLQNKICNITNKNYQNYCHV
jgi:hypothetical protein